MVKIRKHSNKRVAIILMLYFSGLTQRSWESETFDFEHLVGLNSAGHVSLLRVLDSALLPHRMELQANCKHWKFSWTFHCLPRGLPLEKKKGNFH